MFCILVMMMFPFLTCIRPSNKGKLVFVVLNIQCGMIPKNDLLVQWSGKGCFKLETRCFAICSTLTVITKTHFRSFKIQPSKYRPIIEALERRLYDDITEHVPV